MHTENLGKVICNLYSSVKTDDEFRGYCDLDVKTEVKVNVTQIIKIQPLMKILSKYSRVQKISNEHT
jgi:hypothetical protein